MTAESEANLDLSRENRLVGAYRLDKIAIGVIGVAMTFVFGQMWGISGHLNGLEVSLAETRGRVDAQTTNIGQLMDRGSQTAQRTEVLVQEIQSRINKIEEFMSRGPRFTADDGARLEKRIERLENNAQPKR